MGTMDYWTTELDDYIHSAVEEDLNVVKIADYLGISIQRLCQHILYIYGYPLEDRIAVEKNIVKEPSGYRYTPFEKWVYGGKEPEIHSPMETWLSALPYEKVELKETLASGFQFPYSLLDSIMSDALPGLKQKDWRTSNDYVSAGKPIGTWLYDRKRGETTYFFGMSRSRLIDESPYKAELYIPGGLYAVFPVELWSNGYRGGSSNRAYGGALIRERVCRDLQKTNSYLDYDEDRFCFESYNGKKELSLFVPIEYPLGFTSESLYWLHMEL